jgi:uncharacterized membrane protein YtjA (UPF0391 family)
MLYAERMGTYPWSAEFLPRCLLPTAEFISMIKWILILLVIAAVASLLGFHTLAGAAATGARILIVVVLILFLLVLFGLITVA